MRQRSWQSMMGCIYGVTLMLLLQGCISHSGPTGTFQVPVSKYNQFGIIDVSRASLFKRKAALVISDPFLRATTNIRVQCSVTDYTYVIHTGKQYVNLLLEQLPGILASQVTVIPSRASAPTGYDLYIEPSVPKITADVNCEKNYPGAEMDSFSLSLRGNGIVRIVDNAGQILAEVPWDSVQENKHAAQGIKSDISADSQRWEEADQYPVGTKIEMGTMEMYNSHSQLYTKAMIDLREKLPESEDLRKYLQSH